MTPQSSFGNNSVNQYSRQPSYTGPANPYPSQTPNAQAQQAQQYQFTAQQQPPLLVAAHPGNYSQNTAAMNYNRPAPNMAQPVPYNAQQLSISNQQRTAEAYILSDAANASIPKEIRDQFPQDDQGRLLFFTTPPFNTQHIVSGSTDAEKLRPLEHTEKHMNAMTIRKRKLHSHEVSGDTNVDPANDGLVLKTKQVKVDLNQPSDKNMARNHDQRSSQTKPLATGMDNPLSTLTNQMQQAIYNEYKSRCGDKWRQTLLADLTWGEERRAKELKNDKLNEERRKAFSSSHLQNPNGQYALNQQGYITDWQKDFFTGTYLDDFDSRLP